MFTNGYHSSVITMILGEAKNEGRQLISLCSALCLIPSQDTKGLTQITFEGYVEHYEFINIFFLYSTKMQQYIP